MIIISMFIRSSLIHTYPIIQMVMTRLKLNISQGGRSSASVFRGPRRCRGVREFTKGGLEKGG